MVEAVFKYFRLIWAVIRFGRLRHSGRNFSEERKENLKDLSEFIPRRRMQNPFGRLMVLPSFLWRNAYFRNVLIQFGFINRSFIKRGGHLHIPFLNVSYIRIPKAANTSLSWAVLQSIYPDLKDRSLTTQQINFLTDVNLKTEVTTEDASDIFFTVVRNPFARIVSVYRDFFQQPGGPFQYEDYLFGVLTKDLSFQKFIDRLQFIPPGLLDPHFRPQYQFLETYQRRENNLIVLKLEKHGDVDSFLSIYNMHIPFLNRSAEPYDYRSYYDAHTLDAVYRMYKKDVATFQYEKEYKELTERVFLQAAKVPRGDLTPGSQPKSI